MKDWLFLYEKHNYNDADNFWNNLQKASKGYGIKISEPEWVEMGDRSNNYEDWTETVNDYMKKYKYQFVLFFLDRNDFIYKNLKKHSLSEKGYISQVVKVFSVSIAGTVIVSVAGYTKKFSILKKAVTTTGV